MSNNATLERALAILRSAPGPAPWYATAPPLRAGEPLRWCVPWEDRGDFGGGNVLLDAAGSVFLILPQYSCAQLIESWLFCWRELKDRIAICIFDTNAFKAPFAKSIADAREKAAGAGPKLSWASGLVWEAQIPQIDHSDSEACQFPHFLEEVQELLFWAHKGTTRLYQLLPKRKEIVVNPQHWFNDGDYDLGYQWPVTVARDPESQVVLGYGIRLGVFALDSSLRNVAVWLRKDY